CDASRYPAEPGWTFALPDFDVSSGSQPISSCEAEHTTRSAERIFAIRLGRASMRWGSCKAVVAEYTETLSPPSSAASAPHSGSHANTLIAAKAGRAASIAPSANKVEKRVLMGSPQNLCAPWAPRL